MLTWASRFKSLQPCEVFPLCSAADLDEPGLEIRVQHHVEPKELEAVRPSWGFAVWGLNGVWFMVYGLKFRVRCLGLSVQGLGFGVSGLELRVSGFGFRVWGLGFGVLGFGFRVSGFGFRV